MGGRLLGGAGEGTLETVGGVAAGGGTCLGSGGVGAYRYGLPEPGASGGGG